MIPYFGYIVMLSDVLERKHRPKQKQMWHWANSYPCYFIVNIFRLIPFCTIKYPRLIDEPDLCRIPFTNHIRYYWKVWGYQMENRGRTDNTMARGKRTKGQTTIYKARHRKLKSEQHEPHGQPGVNSCGPEGNTWLVLGSFPWCKMVVIVTAS